jgi:uncharacterized protein (TIGR02246 family)
MKTCNPLFAGIITSALIGSALLGAEELDPRIAALQKTAAEFVTAYNDQDAAALAALFTVDGEITVLTGDQLASGRAEIQARYEQIFADEPRHISIEVGSVRFVAPNVAIEDGVFHLTPADDESAPPQSTSFTTVMVKEESALDWRIASTRTLGDATDAAGQLSDLADVLKGEWTCRTPDGVRLDLAFGWDEGGKFVIGEMLATTADAEPQKGSIRIGWDAARQQIVSWIFDAAGGFTQGAWIRADDGWMIRSEGTTGDGESLSAIQQLGTQGGDTLIWAVTQRVVEGEKTPDKILRWVRPAPEPAND